MIIKLLPDFDRLPGYCRTPAGLVRKLRRVAEMDEHITQLAASLAIATDPETRGWYVASIQETQYEASNLAKTDKAQ
jgi:hypothetical protein